MVSAISVTLIDFHLDFLIGFINFFKRSDASKVLTTVACLLSLYRSQEIAYEEVGVADIMATGILLLMQIDLKCKMPTPWEKCVSINFLLFHCDKVRMHRTPLSEILTYTFRLVQIHFLNVKIILLPFTYLYYRNLRCDQLLHG